MSIQLDDIFIPAGRGDAGGALFDGLRMLVPKGVRVGVLGLPKSGKSTLLRLMCGTAVAERGRVERKSRVSWPIPLNAFLSTSGTVGQNIRFVGRLYGVTDAEFCGQVARSVGIAEYLGYPLKKCPKFVKPRLALALVLGIDFDIYLFDDSLAGADRAYKNEAAELVAERTAGRGYVLATANPSEAEKKCDLVYVLEQGRARYFADAKEGVKRLKELVGAQKMKSPSRRKSRQGEEENDDVEESPVEDVDVIGAAIADVAD